MLLLTAVEIKWWLLAHGGIQLVESDAYGIPRALALETISRPSSFNWDCFTYWIALDSGQNRYNHTEIGAYFVDKPFHHIDAMFTIKVTPVPVNHWACKLYSRHSRHLNLLFLRVVYTFHEFSHTFLSIMFPGHTRYNGGGHGTGYYLAQGFQ